MNILHIHAKRYLLVGFIFFLSFLKVHSQEGAQIFRQNCATCHAFDKELSAPPLRGVTGRGPWVEDIKNLHSWIKNAPANLPKWQYTQDLQKKYGQVMTNFSSVLSDADVDAVIKYLENPPPPPGSGEGGDGKDTKTATDPNRNAIIFGVISLILALITLLLMQVNSNLKKLSDDKENIVRPEPVPFYRNKVYIALFAIVFFIVGGYFVGKGAIGLGRQRGYQPTQPIYYSHKVHAGINQINCLYCHGGAWESKHAGIPSLNICMNCHKVVNTYEKGPQLYDEDGNKIDGTAEINKLYKYAGFKPGPNVVWDPSKATSPQWVKIHNLPDHVYFNHAQHVKVGNVACQTCHGNIQEMDKVQQEAELSMGWCVNCHRESKVNFNYSDSTGNKFYSIYEKFHNDIKNHKMDSVTVKDIGGLECQKCHY
ncbi:MAG: c-type cytochrome [Flavisolibacter sp.]